MIARHNQSVRHSAQILLQNFIKINHPYNSTIKPAELHISTALVIIHKSNKCPNKCPMKWRINTKIHITQKAHPFRSGLNV